TFDVTGLEPAHVETIAMTCSDDLGNAATSAPLVVATAGAVVCTSVGAGNECAPGDFCSPELFDVGAGQTAHVCTLDENIAPGPISDLSVVASGTTLTSLTLRFSAPGDDGFAPGTRAKRYVAHVT